MSLFSSIRGLLDWLRNPPQATGPFPASYEDVCRARAVLKTLGLPTEIVLEILDHACYWPTHQYHTQHIRPVIAAARGGRPSAAVVCLDVGIFKNPVVDAIRASGETAKIKAVEFDFVSLDQGWTSENTYGTYATSSWLEVSILRDEENSGRNPPRQRPPIAWMSSPFDWHDIRPATTWALVKRPESALQGPQEGEGDFAWYLQGNQVAANSQAYRVVWGIRGHEGNEGSGPGEGFLEELTEGDRILVWARAKWPGWQCIVESIKLTVHYGF